MLPFVSEIYNILRLAQIVKSYKYGLSIYLFSVRLLAKNNIPNMMLVQQVFFAADAAMY